MFPDVADDDVLDGNSCNGHLVSAEVPGDAVEPWIVKAGDQTGHIRSTRPQNIERPGLVSVRKFDCMCGVAAMDLFHVNRWRIGLAFRELPDNPDKCSLNGCQVVTCLQQLSNLQRSWCVATAPRYSLAAVQKLRYCLARMLL